MHCDQFLVRIDAYLAEEMDDAERTAFRSHQETCKNCREVALTLDPTLLFAAIPRREPDPARVEACAAAVTALIHQDRLERKMRKRAPRWMMAAAAVLFLMIGASAIWMTGSNGVDNGPEIAMTTEVEAPTEAATADAEPPRVEVNMAGEGVRVYQFAQEEDSNTAVYFIVNSAMEL